MRHAYGGHHFSYIAAYAIFRRVASTMRDGRVLLPYPRRPSGMRKKLHGRAACFTISRALLR